VPVADRLQQFFISQFDYFAARTRARLDGLTDDEYLWEPVPGCWSVRPGPNGFVYEHTSPEPDPPPITTIAWRLVHLSWCLSDHGLRRVAFDGDEAAWEEATDAPGTAADALAHFDQSVNVWKADLARTGDERLWEPMGPAAGPFGEDPVAGFVEHIHDEFIHHSAEIGVLRDLYRAGLAPRR
jgi:hypothetical protein